ncbi:hypothetical protein CUU62_21905 [Pseudomonas sp. WP001]|nr:hypothetical protein CUU62_21905 [Pseudomonas sp. WP001]
MSFVVGLKASSGHRYLHNSAAPNRNHDAKRAALDLDLDPRCQGSCRVPRFLKSIPGAARVWSCLSIQKNVKLRC